MSAFEQLTDGPGSRSHDRAHIGVTSTRNGLTEAQTAVARRLLAQLVASGATTLHSGDCVGGDAQLQALAHEAGLRVVAHPGPGGRYRAHGYSDEERPVRPFAARNQDIVDASGTLIGLPPTEPDDELTRSGTWQTIRMGRRAGIRVVVIGPSGHHTDTEYSMQEGPR